MAQCSCLVEQLRGPRVTDRRRTVEPRRSCRGYVLVVIVVIPVSLDRVVVDGLVVLVVRLTGVVEMVLIYIPRKVEC